MLTDSLFRNETFRIDSCGRRIFGGNQFQTVPIELKNQFQTDPFELDKKVSQEKASEHLKDLIL